MVGDPCGCCHLLQRNAQDQYAPERCQKPVWLPCCGYTQKNRTSLILLEIKKQPLNPLSIGAKTGASNGEIPLTRLPITVSLTAMPRNLPPFLQLMQF